MLCYGFLVFLLFTLTKSASIVPGTYWTDTNGVVIQAHGGGFLKLNDTYYWFGEDKTENSHHFRHVNVYKSTDLVTWEYLAHALSATEESAPISEIGRDAVVERPKVIYNERTGQFVMWFHLDSNDYSLAKLGIATSSRVEGPYTYHGSVAPFDEDSRDMTVWIDDDANKTAYVFYATRVNLDTVIARLSPDYLSVEQRIIKFEGIHREAYAVFKRNGLYYMVTSAATGWNSNRNGYMYSPNLSGPWSSLEEIAPGSSNTYDSQSNYIIPVSNGQFIFAGDRWNPNALSDSKYVWLPIRFSSGNSISIGWDEQWWIDTRSGNWGPSTFISFEAETGILMGSAAIHTCQGCTGGKVVGDVGFTGRIRFENIGTASNSSYSILISYVNGDSSPRFASVDVNGQYLRTISFPTTNSGHNTKQIVFQTELRQGNDNTIEFYSDNSWAPDFDYVRFQL